MTSTYIERRTQLEFQQTLVLLEEVCSSLTKSMSVSMSLKYSSVELSRGFVNEALIRDLWSAREILPSRVG